MLYFNACQMHTPEFQHTLDLSQFTRKSEYAIISGHMWSSRSVLGLSTEGYESEPHYGQQVVSLSKVLYHNYSSLPRCINGYRQCWEGNRFVMKEM